MAGLLGRREIGLLPAGVKNSELISKHVHTIEGVCSSSFILLLRIIIATTGQ